jgi:hypothetical protein
MNKRLNECRALIDHLTTQLNECHALIDHHLTTQLNECRAALVDHVTTHLDRKYRVSLVSMRIDPRRWMVEADAVAADFDLTATPIDPAGEPFRLQLHLSRWAFDDRRRLLDAIDRTVIDILEGRLPPGTKSLL